MVYSPDNLSERVILKLELVCGEAGVVENFGYKMLLGNVELLLVGVAGDLDDFHAVQKRSRNGVKRVGRGNKEDV